MPNTRSAKLARWQIWLLSVSGTLLWLSGAVWLLLHYYGKVQGEFGPENNPLEAWFLRLHGFTLIPILLGIGGLFIVHFPKGWKDKRQRVIGLGLAVVGGVLILSGYMLYYVGLEWLRDWTSVVHWVIGLASPILFIWHYQGRRPVKKSAKAADSVADNGRQDA
jgi:hypothetical protein